MPGWPAELGGRDASPVQQMIYFEEMSRREIPRSLNPQAVPKRRQVTQKEASASSFTCF